MVKQAGEKLFFEFLHEREPFLSEKTFYDPGRFEWTGLIEKNHPAISREIMAFFESHQSDFNPYFINELMNAPGKWRSFGFYFWGRRAPYAVCKHFSETIHLLKTIPNLVSASISVMEPNSEIRPHYGDTNAIYRCHFGIVIPGQLPDIGFQAGYEKRSWEEGKFLIFNDAAYHKAWNYTNERRLVLILDVVRPEFEHRKLWICAKVQSIIVSQTIIKKYPKTKWLLQSRMVQWILSMYKWVIYRTVKRGSLWL
jgi:aspartyl/asparaginyl beta-hydroxylase (cupin superfamily)